MREDVNVVAKLCFDDTRSQRRMTSERGERKLEG